MIRDLIQSARAAQYKRKKIYIFLSFKIHSTLVNNMSNRRPPVDTSTNLSTLPPTPREVADRRSRERINARISEHRQDTIEIDDESVSNEASIPTSLTDSSPFLQAAPPRRNNRGSSSQRLDHALYTLRTLGFAPPPDSWEGYLEYILNIRAIAPAVRRIIPEAVQHTQPTNVGPIRHSKGSGRNNPIVRPQGPSPTNEDVNLIRMAFVSLDIQPIEADSFFQKHWTGALANKAEWDQSSDFSLVPTRRATCHEHRSFDSTRIEEFLQGIKVCFSKPEFDAARKFPAKRLRQLWHESRVAPRRAVASSQPSGQAMEH